MIDIKDRTDEWEDSIDQDLSSKLKYPLKFKDDMEGFDTEVENFTIELPVKKKTSTAKVVDISKRGRNKNKGLF